MVRARQIRRKDRAAMSARRVLVVAAVCLFAACGGGSGGGGTSGIVPGSPSAGNSTGSPTATPTASPTPPTSPILFKDYSGNQVVSLQLSGTGDSYAQTLHIVQDGYSGAFTASGCGGIATATVSTTNLTVTGQSVGSCTLTVSDKYGISAALSVSVTTTSVDIH